MPRPGDLVAVYKILSYSVIASAAALRLAMQQDSSFMRDIRVTSSQKLTLVFGNAIVLGHDFHLRSGAVASLHLPVRTDRSGMWTWNQEFLSIFF